MCVNVKRLRIVEHELNILRITSPVTLSTKTMIKSSAITEAWSPSIEYNTVKILKFLHQQMLSARIMFVTVLKGFLYTKVYER